MANVTDPTRIGKVHGNGPDNHVVESGGTHSFLSGSTLDLQLGANINVGAGESVAHVAKVALAAVDTAGGLFSWQNPQAGSILVSKVNLYTTTKATGACTADCGTTAASATTLSDNLVDGADLGTAAGVFDNNDTDGTNAKTRQLLAAGKWVTGSVASGASAGLVGFAYIHYFLL